MIMVHIVSTDCPIRHDGVTYRKDDEITGLSAGDSAPLLEAGLIRAKPVQSKREKHD